MIVTFAELASRFRKSPTFIAIACLVFVLVIELPMKAQALSEDRPALFWFALFLSGAVFFFLARWVDAEAVSSLLPLEGHIAQIAIVGILTGVGVFGFRLLLDQVFLSLIPDLYISVREMAGLLTGASMMIAFLSGGVILAVGEEKMFRGYLLSSINERRGLVFALLISALIYGLRTFDPFAFVVNFLIGIFLGLLTLRFNLATAVASHIVANLALIIFLSA